MLEILRSHYRVAFTRTIKKELKIFGEEDHVGNISNIQTAHVPFTYVFIALGSGIRRSAGVKLKLILKNKYQISKT